MSDWKEIASAPRDGTEIILRKGDRVTAGAWIEWSKSEAAFNNRGDYLGQDEYDSGAHWASWDGGFCEDDEPTHWQPIPAPPSDEDENERRYLFETGAYEVELGQEKWAAIHTIFENYNSSEIPSEEFTCSEGEVTGLVSEILIALDLARAE